jgi:RNA polymerase sigma factor (sigma-70 family)
MHSVMRRTPQNGHYAAVNSGDFSVSWADRSPENGQYAALVMPRASLNFTDPDRHRCRAEPNEILVRSSVVGLDAARPGLRETCESEYPRLVRMLALYTGDQHRAEDIAQESLIRLHQRWDSISEIVSIRAWLSTVALNLARSWWRRQFAESRANAKDSSARQYVVIEPDQADALTVRSAVSALPDRQRAAVVLRFYAGLSVAETAAALRCREGTVKSLTHQAISNLRVRLAIDTFEEPTLHA